MGKTVFKPKTNVKSRRLLLFSRSSFKWRPSRIAQSASASRRPTPRPRTRATCASGSSSGWHSTGRSTPPSSWCTGTSSSRGTGRRFSGRPSSSSTTSRSVQVRLESRIYRVISEYIFISHIFSNSAEVDQHLKDIFADLSDGARIFSSKSFCALNFRITDRNLSGEREKNRNLNSSVSSDLGATVSPLPSSISSCMVDRFSSRSSTSAVSARKLPQNYKFVRCEFMYAACRQKAGCSSFLLLKAAALPVRYLFIFTHDCNSSLREMAAHFCAPADKRSGRRDLFFPIFGPVYLLCLTPSWLIRVKNTCIRS